MVHPDAGTPTIAFDYAGNCKAKPPVPGAIAVYWLLERGWVHKGWLMPAIAGEQ